MSFNAERDLFGGELGYIETEEDKPKIKLHIIKKNESALAHYKHLKHLIKAVNGDDDVQRFCMNESYSFYYVPILDPLQANRGRE